MNEIVQQFLEAFDALPAAARHEAVVEILRKFTADTDLPDDTLVGAADELFRNLDAEESGHAPR
jgi:predicted HAD superfamily phosphohydrolase